MEVPLEFSIVFFGRSLLLLLWMFLDVGSEEGFGTHLLVMVGAFVISEY